MPLVSAILAEQAFQINGFDSGIGLDLMVSKHLLDINLNVRLLGVKEFI